MGTNFDRDRGEQGNPLPAPYDDFGCQRIDGYGGACGEGALETMSLQRCRIVDEVQLRTREPSHLHFNVQRLDARPTSERTLEHEDRHFDFHGHGNVKCPGGIADTLHYDRRASADRSLVGGECLERTAALFNLHVRIGTAGGRVVPGGR